MARRHQAIDRHLGGRVRFARIEKKISQTLLGERLGISFQQVQKYELGKDRISASQLMSIARILEKDISFFFEEIEADADPIGTEPVAVAPERTSRSDKVYDIKIIRLLHAIENEKLKARLYHLMEAIVGARRQPAPFDPRLALLNADEHRGRRPTQ